MQRCVSVHAGNLITTRKSRSKKPGLSFTKIILKNCYAKSGFKSTTEAEGDVKSDAGKLMKS